MRKIWPPRRRRVKLSVALPTNVLSEAPTLREKTIKLGLIIRALAIFRVDRIILFKQEPNEEKLICNLIKYHLMPPYLKRYIPLRNDLRYVGLLPPLKVPAHTTPKTPLEALRYGYREVVVTKVGDVIEVDSGLRYPSILIDAKSSVKVGAHLIARVRGIKGNKLVLEEVSISQIPFYWRPTLGPIYNGLYELLRNERFCIGTSRYGKQITKVWNDLKSLISSTREVILVFGSPREGLYEIAKRENFILEENMSMVINFIPEQGTETVRTEEAIFACLAIMNLLLE